MKDLVQRDQKHLWHPLTQHKTNGRHLPIVKALGSLLYDHTGKSYIDGIASWYTTMYGHCHPYLINFVSKRMSSLDQVVFTGFTHPPAIEMSERLVAILPKGQQKLFFSDNGSTAVEVALKMAVQYHANKGHAKTKIIAFENAFHGDTFGAMSVSGLSVYNGAFEAFFIEVIHIPLPNEENLEAVKQLFKAHLETEAIAAFIFEPLIQGAAGMRCYKAGHLGELIALAQSYKTLCIADEVMTGFGKTGTHFACEQLQEQPDICCLSKALTGGLVPMGITTCTLKVYEAFYDDDLRKGLFHGHTYSANPMACNAVIAGIDLLTSPEVQRQKTYVEAQHQQFIEKIKDHPKVQNARAKGMMMAFELKESMARYGDKRNQIFDFLMKEGLFIRPLGATIYMLPPFVITPEELAKSYHIIAKILDR